MVTSPLFVSLLKVALGWVKQNWVGVPLFRVCSLGFNPHKLCFYDGLQLCFLSESHDVCRAMLRRQLDTCLPVGHHL